MQILETHALSEKEAVELTVKYLSVEPDQIQVKVHRKGASGFLGLGDKKPNTYYVFAIEGKTPRDVVIKGILSTILHKMGYKAKVIDIHETENNKILAELASPKAGHIIGRKGKTLEALQTMTNLLLENFLRQPVRIILDIENYRDRREKSLENMANRMAAQVEESGRARMVDPMNPYERRIVHMALQDHEGVETESIGTGIFKKIRIRPTENNQRNNSSSDQADADPMPAMPDHSSAPMSDAPLYEKDFPNESNGVDGNMVEEPDEVDGNIIEEPDEVDGNVLKENKRS